MSIVQYTIAHTDAQFQVARQLILQYAQGLDLNLDFQNFDQEMQHLATEYNRPHGVLLLAHIDHHPAGIVALHQFDGPIAEMKRLYVVPAYRHLGIARELISRLLIQAQHLGYQSVRLDTLPTMTSAQALYHAMGFVPIDAYRYNPVPGTLYLEHFFNPKTH